VTRLQALHIAREFPYGAVRHVCELLYSAYLLKLTCVFVVAKRNGRSNDDAVGRRIMSNHVTKMAAAGAADDRPNTVRIRVIVPDVKYQVQLLQSVYTR